MYMTSFFVYFKWLLDKFRSSPSKIKVTIHEEVKLEKLQPQIILAWQPNQGSSGLWSLSA